MNLHVFGNAFRTGRVGLIWYFVAAIIGVAAGGAGLGTLQGASGAAITEVVKQLPAPLLTAFKINLSSFTSPVGYIAARSLSFFVPLILIAFAAGNAGGVSQFIERGTIHFELSLPMSRWRWLLSRIGSGALGLLCIVGVATLALYAFASAEWWRYSVYGCAFGLLWLGIAYAVAAFSRERSAVTTLVFGFFGVQYLLSIVASINADTRWLENLSLWSAYQPEAVLLTGIPWGTVLMWCAIGLLGFGVALWQWQRRDLPA